MFEAWLPALLNWPELNTLTRGFYLVALFFSVIAIWQLIATFSGLVGGDDVDVDGDVEGDFDGDVDVDGPPQTPPDGTGLPDIDDLAATRLSDELLAADAATIAAFKLLSVRSILAFCTLFSWAGAMYLDQGKETGSALIFAFLWGGAAMGIVAGIFYLMRRLSETGTQRLGSALRRRGVAYLEIPEGGEGQVRVRVSGIVSYVKARGTGGQAIPSGTPVRVVRTLDQTTVEVEPLTKPEADALAKQEPSEQSERDTTS